MHSEYMPHLSLFHYVALSLDFFCNLLLCFNFVVSCESWNFVCFQHQILMAKNDPLVILFKLCMELNFLCFFLLRHHILADSICLFGAGVLEWQFVCLVFPGLLPCFTTVLVLSIINALKHIRLQEM